MLASRPRRGARGLRSDKQGTKAKTWFGIVRNNREHLI
jgi:hypothetical protein